MGGNSGNDSELENSIRTAYFNYQLQAGHSCNTKGHKHVLHLTIISVIVYPQSELEDQHPGAIQTVTEKVIHACRCTAKFRDFQPYYIGQC